MVLEQSYLPLQKVHLFRMIFMNVPRNTCFFDDSATANFIQKNPFIKEIPKQALGKMTTYVISTKHAKISLMITDSHF